MPFDNLNDSEELRYLEDLKVGKRDAFDFIYARYSKMLLPKMQRMIKSSEIADELMQDCFFKKSG